MQIYEIDSSTPSGEISEFCCEREGDVRSRAFDKLYPINIMGALFSSFFVKELHTESII